MQMICTSNWGVEKKIQGQQIGFSEIFCKLWFRNFIYFHLLNPHFPKLSLQPMFLVWFVCCQMLLLISVADACLSDYLAEVCEQACVWLLLAWHIVWYGISILAPCCRPPLLLGILIQQGKKNQQKAMGEPLAVWWSSGPFDQKLPKGCSCFPSITNYI